MVGASNLMGQHSNRLSLVRSAECGADIGQLAARGASGFAGALEFPLDGTIRVRGDCQEGAGKGGHLQVHLASA
jgi:hypothetical protein